MNLDEPIPWSKKRLKRLGKALVDGAPIPEGCPSYEEVVVHHDDLAAEIAAMIELHEWDNLFESELALSARPKTVDTLVEKLRRRPPYLALHEVQDIAGIRIDSAALCLTHQRAAAQEMADYFGYDSEVHDLLDDPHSGYRAVHVWVRVPAGRAEIQIRTQAQSAWANTYEALAGIVGRGIRYGEDPITPAAENLVVQMQVLSLSIARVEKRLDELERLYGCPGVPLDHLTEIEADAVHSWRSEALDEERVYVETLERVESMLKDMEASA